MSRLLDTQSDKNCPVVPWPWWIEQNALKSCVVVEQDKSINQKAFWSGSDQQGGPGCGRLWLPGSYASKLTKWITFSYNSHCKWNTDTAGSHRRSWRQLHMFGCPTAGEEKVILGVVSVQLGRRKAIKQAANAAGVWKINFCFSVNVPKPLPMCWVVPGVLRAAYENVVWRTPCSSLLSVVHIACLQNDRHKHRRQAHCLDPRLV